MEFPCNFCWHPITPDVGERLDELTCPACNKTFAVPDERRTVGQYRIDACIGIGGFGNVWSADSLNDQVRVALKNFQDNKDELSRLSIRHMMRESRIGAKLSHPNICPVRDFNCINGVYYVVSELIDGPDLSLWLSNDETPDLAQRCDIFFAICDAVEYLHGVGIVHHDLKPRNILIRDDSQPILIDFGLATSRDDDSQRIDQLHRLAMGMNSQFLPLPGTIDYMPPEKIKGELKTGIASDIYSLGVILYELLASRRPYVGNYEEVRQAILKGRRSSPRRWNRKIPAGLANACLTAMSHKPEARHTSVAALREECQQQAQFSDDAASGPSAPVQASFWRRLLPFKSTGSNLI